MFRDHSPQVVQARVEIRLSQADESAQLAQHAWHQAQARAVSKAHVELLVQLDEIIDASRFGGPVLTAQQRSQLVHVIVRHLAARMHDPEATAAVLELDRIAQLPRPSDRDLIRAAQLAAHIRRRFE